LKKIFTSSGIKYLKELFDETGYSSIWINEDIPNSNWLISIIKLRLHEQFKQGFPNKSLAQNDTIFIFISIR
jgi:hypothetical protein